MEYKLKENFREEYDKTHLEHNRATLYRMDLDYLEGLDYIKVLEFDEDGDAKIYAPNISDFGDYAFIYSDLLEPKEEN